MKNPNAAPADRPHHTIWPKRLPRELAVPQTPLGFNLDVAAARFPDKPAYLFMGRALTFGELRRQADAVAGWLQAMGVAPGERVAIFMQNCPQFAVAFYGILRAGAVVVPVNPMNRAEEFSHFITDPQTRVVICTADLAAIVASANAQVPEALRLAAVLVTRFTDAMPD
ncbi:MAG TPA: AMP-binding protein, partial [Burkholderiaceae bacterium]